MNRVFPLVQRNYLFVFAFFTLSCRFHRSFSLWKKHQTGASKWSYESMSTRSICMALCAADPHLTQVILFEICFVAVKVCTLLFRKMWESKQFVWIIQMITCVEQQRKDRRFPSRIKWRVNRMEIFNAFSPLISTRSFRKRSHPNTRARQASVIVLKWSQLNYMEK